MRFWKRKVQPLTREQIDSAIDDDAWQTFRLSLKGIPTSEKLERLIKYQDEDVTEEEEVLRSVRVDNYINALLRGGQLKKICNEMLVVNK